MDSIEFLLNSNRNRKETGRFSNYCGLGGDGPVQHEVDEACRIHDEDYGVLIRKGINPYGRFNDADQKFMHNLQQISPKSFREYVAQLGGQTFLKLKDSTLIGKIAGEFINHLYQFKKEMDTSSLRDHFISQLALEDTSDMPGGHIRRRDNEGHLIEAFETPPKRPRPVHTITPDNQLAIRAAGAPDVDMGGDDDDNNFSLAATASSTHHNGHETQITKAPRVERPFVYGNTFTTKLKGRFDMVARMDGNARQNFTIRLTSLTDIHAGLGTATYGTTAGSRFAYQDPSGQPLAYGLSTSSQTMVLGWYPWLKQLYEQYAVLGCHYKVTFKNLNSDVGKDFSAAMQIRGADAPPSRTIAQFLDAQDTLRIKRIRSQFEKGAQPTTFEGYYRPGDYKDLVVEDANIKIWTAVDSQPTHPEQMIFNILPYPPRS